MTIAHELNTNAIVLPSPQPVPFKFRNVTARSHKPVLPDKTPATTPSVPTADDASTWSMSESRTLDASVPKILKVDTVSIEKELLLMLS